MSIELVPEGSHPRIYHIEVGGKRIGTMHMGSEADTEDEGIVHINIQPKFHSSGYDIIKTIRHPTQLYIRLLKGRGKERGG